MKKVSEIIKRIGESKKIVLFIIFYPVLASFVLSQNYVDSSGLKQGKWLFENMYDTIIHEDNTTYVINFKDDMFNGEFLVIDKNGVKRRQSYYRNDTIIGDGYMYSKKGKLIAVFSFNNDNAIITKRVYENGKLGTIRNYESYDNNVLNGPYYLFFSNGRLFTERYFKSGNVLYDRLYWKNGKRRTETVYQTPENEYSSYSTYYRTGQPKMILTTKKNVQTRTYYKRNGGFKNTTIKSR